MSTTLSVTALQQQVRRTIRRHDLLPPGSRVLVALSGGGDSVALTFLLSDLVAFGGFAVVGLAHFNHRLREAADDDEAFCRRLADRLALPFFTDSADVRRYAQVNRLSTEEAARRLRYQFLERAALAAGADTITVGHTEDDQAETFLLKLARGAGLSGLGGVYPRRGRVVRPLLEVSRAELRGYLRARGEPWVEDETNVGLDAARNRIRHDVLPALDRAYGGPTTPALARAAELAREDGTWLDDQAARRYEALAVATSASVEFPAEALAMEPIPIRRRIVLMGMRAVAGGKEIGAVHVQAALAALAGLGSTADIPGGRVELRAGKLVLSDRGPGSK